MKAELVLYNGRVHTMDAARPRAEAVAVAGRRILAVGSHADVAGLAGTTTRSLDLRGRTLIPGLIDAHVHFGWHSIAVSQQRLDLDNAPKETILALVAERARSVPPERWILGGGWNQNVWPEPVLPSAADLDAVAPQHPVVLQSKSYHATWANSRALALAGITAATDDPPGGQIVRDAAGQPTGVLLENAADLVDKVIPEPDVAEMVAALRAGMAHAHRLGLVGIHDPGHEAVLAAFQALRDPASGRLPFRVLMHLPAAGLDAAVALGVRSGLGDEYVRIGGIKLFADGALGPQTAYMLSPYEGSPDNLGIPTLTRDELHDLVGRAQRAGLSVAIHAIGDAANRLALDAIEQAQRESNEVSRPALPNRIEHVQMLHPDDLPRLAQLGVVASMQPIHATSDMDMAERFWGRRSDLAYAWRSVLDGGAALAFGSDCPVETLDPLAGIHAAVTRRRADGSPGAAGWIPAQRLTVAEALHAYTLGAARASGEERLKGSISPGKLADLVVLSHDIFDVPPDEILDTAVVMTLVDGQVVHTDPAQLETPVP